jgi:hypothetical protein
MILPVDSGPWATFSTITLGLPGLGALLVGFAMRLFAASRLRRRRRAFSAQVRANLGT